MRKFGVVSRFSLALTMGLMVATGCKQGEQKTETAASPATAAAGAAAGAPSDWQQKNGIGPVTAPLTLPATVDAALAAKGKAIFESKCAMCHKFDERYVGPPLREVLKRRTPEYVVNMIMNPLEMTAKHPEAKKLLGEYFNQMPFQNVTLDEAKQVLEYVRSETK